MDEIVVSTKKKKFAALWEKIKRHKKRAILLAVLFVLAVSGLIVACKLSRRTPDGTTYSFVRTTTLSSGSLSNTVSTTGTVESRETSTVSYTGEATGKTPKVKEILVAVGDEVKAGDVIVRLDTADLLEQIEKAEENLAESQESAQDSYDEAEDAYSTASSNASAQYKVAKAAKTAMNEAYGPYKQALDSIESFQSAYDDAVSAWQTAGVNYNNAVAAGGDGEAEKLALDNAAAAMNEAESTLKSMKSNCNFDALEKAYTNAKSTYEKEYSSYEQMEEQANSAYDRVESAEKALSKADSSDTLDDLYSSLEACNLKAEADGKITALNATVGSSPTGAVATIQNLKALWVSITIPEADINSVSVGMACIITSDATEGDIHGTLSQIDPISGMSGSFGAEVTVDDEDTGLWAGMNASVEIIISQSNVGFSVPADAVGNDNDGEGSYVYRQTGGEGVDMTFEKVYVNTADSNDYYIQILSDELSAGDVIRSSADLTQGIETVEADEEGGFSFGSLFGGMGGGMPGGDMPGGFSGGDVPSFSGGDMPSFSGGDMPSFSGGSSGGSRPSGGMPSGGMPGGMG